MHKYILLDRDGVINVDTNFLYKIEEFEYEKKTVEALKLLTSLGYKFVVITNQSGIARGKYTEEDFWKLTKFIETDLLNKGIKIEKTYVCPHHPDEKGIYGIDCNCRKPKKGNFLKAIEDFDIDISRSYMVGDKLTDLIPADDLGIKTALVLTGHGKENLDKLKNSKINSIICENLMDFANKLSQKLI